MPDYSRFPNLNTAFDDGVLTVTLNRPERLNAIDTALHNALEAVCYGVWRARALGRPISTPSYTLIFTTTMWAGRRFPTGRSGF